MIISVPSTSGLRDETASRRCTSFRHPRFQYPQPRVYAMKLEVLADRVARRGVFQYPQPRVYAMKLCGKEFTAYSTLLFQYPQPRVYAMKLI